MEGKTDSHFKTINDLYSEYSSLIGKENVENALKTLKERIILEAYDIFCEGNSHRKRENSEYSVEIIDAVIDSLTYFNAGAGRNFAPYMISAIDKKIRLAKTDAKIKDDNSMYIPRDKKSLLRHIQKEEEHLAWIRNPERRREQIRLNLGIQKKDFDILYPLAVNKEVSLNIRLSDDSDITLEDLQESVAIPIQNQLEEKESFETFMNKIQKKWEGSKDKDILSVALTADILGRMFESTSSDAILAKETSEYENLFVSYSFMNREMLHRFFTDATYKLPTQEKIGQIFGGMTKGGVSRKVSRFYDGIITPTP